MSVTKKGLSIEQELKLQASGVFLLVTGLFFLLVHFSEMPLKLALPLYLMLALGLISYLLRVYQRVIQPLKNLTNVVESIRLEDYGMTPRRSFSRGVMAQLLNETTALVEVLRLRKERYTQHVYLIYRLIEQLELPVLVFDDDLRLSHANEAFGQWYGQPWSTVKGLSSKRLGLRPDDTGKWHFINPEAHQGWQIKQSRFLNEKDDYQLLILNNIKSEVRQVQQDAWQQIIRVLTHEIRNSLTPIRSMTELMLDMPDVSEQMKTPLEVIETRSMNLLQFVERYADTAKAVEVNKQTVQGDSLMAKITPLFAQNRIRVEGGESALNADPVLLEQVLINLIRNGLESQQAAGEDAPLSVIFASAKGQTVITVNDRGKGIANLDNLFVPFYTTKQDGQGIGLVFCRKVIEHHGGNLTLVNRKEGGAKAQITLPGLE